MTDSSLRTAQINLWVERMQAGDTAAREELLARVCGRLEQMVRSMLTRYPRVARWEQPDDVLQNSLLRLLRALDAVRPESVRDFYGLAATQIRRELLDLTRHYQGPLGLAANYASQVMGARNGGESAAYPMEPVGSQGVEADLEPWAAFHREVENLPTEEREVVGLIFYHGWTQAEVAELFQVSERTVRRKWQSACERLRHAIGSELPVP